MSFKRQNEDFMRKKAENKSKIIGIFCKLIVAKWRKLFKDDDKDTKSGRW